MLDNLADFEPRRWFSRLRHRAEKNHDEEPPEGLAGLEPEEEDDSQHVVDPARLAPGWDVEPQVLVIGGRSMLDEAAGAMLAAVLEKRGLRAEALPPETISAGHITALASTKAKLVYLSYLGLGTGAAHIRYLVRRLKRILPEGTMIFVAYWDRDEDTDGLKALLELVRADAYATTLQEAVDTCVQAATGELKIERESPASGSSNGKPTRPPAVTPPPKRPTPKGRKPQTAPA